MTTANSAPGHHGESLPLIGAHISTAGGFAAVSARALAMGADAVQIFSSNPRQWPTASPDRVELERFGAGLRALRLPLFLHSIYLINLASPDERLRGRSADALAGALVTGALAGAAGVVTHIGSHRGEGFGPASGLVTGTILAALAAAAETLTTLPSGGATAWKTPALLLETGAGSGATIGDSLEELAVLLAALPPSAGLCLDTAHLFAAGYAVHQTKGFQSLLGDLRRLKLLDRVGLVHLNDSSAPFASRRDRHENPGAGLIGRVGLARIVRHPALASVPFILEVPGPDKHGPTAAEIGTVKAMRRAPTEREALTPPTGPARGASCPEAP